jgi:hypothetical protein
MTMISSMLLIHWARNSQAQGKKPHHSIINNTQRVLLICQARFRHMSNVLALSSDHSSL